MRLLINLLQKYGSLFPNNVQKNQMTTCKAPLKTLSLFLILLLKIDSPAGVCFQKLFSSKNTPLFGRSYPKRIINKYHNDESRNREVSGILQSKALLDLMKTS